MDVNNLTKILNSFDTEKQSFGYNPKNRHAIKHRISPMIREDDSMLTKEAIEERFKVDQEEGMKEYRKAYEMMTTEAGNTWSASKVNFHRGAARSARFIEDDEEEEEPTFTNSRFSKGIDIKKELALARERKNAKLAEERRANMEMNRTEYQHMDFNTSRHDRATRSVIREMKMKDNIDKDYNRVHEVGNTHKITKERSCGENKKIIDRTNRGKGFQLRTTLISTDEGNSSERVDLMSDRNTEIMNSNIADDGDYRDMIKDHDKWVKRHATRR